MVRIGQDVKFISDHQQEMRGTVLDYTDEAIRVSCVIGVMIIKPSQVIKDKINLEYIDDCDGAWGFDYLD